jgi:hypothetical protein
MTKKTIEFYRRFFDYPLNDQDARRILAGLAPIDQNHKPE